MREQVSFDRDELAVILKEHLNLDDAVETRVNYGNAGFTLYLENYEPPTHDEIMSNYRKGGYEKKYIIQKTNGHPIDPKADYFVLRLDTDPHALKALDTYMNSVVNDNEPFAIDLYDLLKKNLRIQENADWRNKAICGW